MIPYFMGFNPCFTELPAFRIGAITDSKAEGGPDAAALAARIWSANAGPDWKARRSREARRVGPPDVSLRLMSMSSFMLSIKLARSMPE
jgi:hypothetical protein